MQGIGLKLMAVAVGRIAVITAVRNTELGVLGNTAVVGTYLMVFGGLARLAINRSSRGADLANGVCLAAFVLGFGLTTYEMIAALNKGVSGG